eukprot:scaffold315172_cov31-Tisochrysis_lutea.AAC.2
MVAARPVAHLRMSRVEGRQPCHHICAIGWRHQPAHTHLGAPRVLWIETRASKPTGGIDTCLTYGERGIEAGRPLLHQIEEEAAARAIHCPIRK